MSQQVDFKQLKEQVSVTDVLGHYGLIDAFRPKADHQLVGPCPFSEGKSKTALKVDTKKQVWYSFALKAGGDIFSFVARKENTNVRGAALLIAEWFGLNGESADQVEAEQATEPPARGAGSIREMQQELLQLLPPGDQGPVVRFVTEKCLESFRNGFEQGAASCA